MHRGLGGLEGRTLGLGKRESWGERERATSQCQSHGVQRFSAKRVPQSPASSFCRFDQLRQPSS